MSSPWSRRAPFPFDCELDVGDGTGWHGLMLVPTQAGLLVGKEADFLGDVAPTSYEYGAARPDEETAFVFGRLTGGMGEVVQSTAGSKRYRYATGVDCSIGGMPRLGPLFTTETFPGLPAGVYPEQNEVRQFVVFREGSVPALFALVRDRVYRRDAAAGAWVLSHDFAPTGGAPRRAVVFRGTAGTEGLWVTLDVGQLWKYDDTTWTQASLPTGPPAAFAERIAAVGHELWIGSGAEVRVCRTGDPLLAASWGGAILVGDQGTRISELAALADTVFVFKWDAIHTLNADASDNDLLPELRTGQLVKNGRNAAAWRDRLWFGFGDAFHALDAGASLEPVGPERLVENTGPVRGRVVSSAGHAGWFLYAVVYDEATTTSHLLKYGTWTPDGGSDAPAAYRFADVWNGALASWPNLAASRCDVVAFDTDLDPTAPGPALWVGFADGSVRWTPLPRRTPDPAADASCRFVPSGRVYAPLHDAVFGADKKAFHGVTALGTVLNEEQTAQVFYRVDPTAPYTALAPAFQISGQRTEFPDLTTGAGRDDSTGFRLDVALELATTTGLLTPVLEGIALHEAVRPASTGPTLRLSYTFTVDASNRVVRRDGVVSRTTDDRARQLLRTAARSAGHVRLRLPDETVGGFAVVAYAEALKPDAGRDGLAAGVDVRLIQYR